MNPCEVTVHVQKKKKKKKAENVVSRKRGMQTVTIYIKKRPHLDSHNYHVTISHCHYVIYFLVTGQPLFSHGPAIQVCIISGGPFTFA